MRFSTLLVPAGLANLGIAGYTLVDDYNVTNFFSMFNFNTADDPTQGYVNYVDQPTAQNDGLINTNNGVVYIGVDNTNIASGRGRNSVRLESKKSYNHGLVIVDLAHMPVGCGTWPAFWTFGPQWPAGGEIDIIEGVNDQTTNDMTLHTGDGCSANSPSDSYTGQQHTYDCYIHSANQSANQGCGFTNTGNNSYGTGFNSNSGGVYAMEWTSRYIQIFFWPANTAPADVLGDTPNPSGWGQPAALFQGACDIDQHFSSHQVTFDMTFCGSWAGEDWGTSSCAAQNGNSCNAFVQNTPSAFKDTFWSVKSLRVYQDGAVSNTADSATSTPQSTSLSAAAPMASSASPASLPSSSTSTVTPTPVASSSTPAFLSSTPMTTSPVTVTVTAAPVVITVAAPSTTLIATPSSVSPSQPEHTLDVLQADEFGAGSKGIPDPWVQKHRRHFGHHIRSAYARP